MSAVAPPNATASHRFTAAADKEALAQFWRSGLEYIAQGITAHHNIARDTRICDVYSRRGLPGGGSVPSLDAQLASHKEILEACVLALAELAASGPVHLSLSHRTRTSPSLETRVAALENQMKGLQETVQPLDTRLKTLTGNQARAESRIKVGEENATAAAARVDRMHKELETRVAGLSTHAANPSPGQNVGHNWVNERLELMAEQVQSSQDESARVRERLAMAETRITVVEATRARVDAHGTKLALMEGKISALQKDIGETRIKMSSLLTLAPEAKALLLVPKQVEQAGQDIQNLKEQQEAASTRFNSLESTLEVAERKLEEANKKNSTLIDSLTGDLSVLDPLKLHVDSLVKLPTTLDQLQASVTELAPLKLCSQGLMAMADQAPQLLGLISHNERVQDDITQIRSKLARHNREIADAKKESTESAHLLNEQMTALSSTNQTIQQEISETASRVALLEASAQKAKEDISGIDAKLTANQVTAQWSQEQIQTMQADVAYLEPLKAQREALLLLSGRTEELMPLSVQFGSPEHGKLLNKGTQNGTAVEATRKLTADISDIQQRLSRVEPHVTQLESDASSALEKLNDLQSTSNTTKGLLERIQNDVTPLLTSSPDILDLVKLAPHCTSLIPLVGEVQALVAEVHSLRKVHASDIVPMKGEVKKIKSISTNIATLRTDMDDTKGKITPLLTLQQQFQAQQDNLGKLEQKVAKLESDTSSSNGPLTIRIPPPNRAGGFSLSQELNTGPSSSGSTRWRASTTISPRKSSSESQQPQPQPPATPPPSASQTQLQAPLPGPGGLIKLTQAADELIALIEKSRQTETEVANLTRSLNRSNKELGELGDSVHGLDQLMTTVQAKSDDDQVTLKLLEREFQSLKGELQNLKEDNAAKLKEVDTKQLLITVMENEIQSLKLDVDAKLKAMETAVGELAPLREHTDMLVALARPVLSPISPAPHASAAPPESRLIALERSSNSATRELRSLNAWVQRIQADLRSCKSLINQVQALEGHVRELVDSTGSMNPMATSLTERASDLLALLERPEGQRESDQSIQLTPEQLEGVARATTRMKTLEEQLHALQTSQPKLKEGLDQVTSQVGELVPTINNVVKPFTDHVKPILSLVPLSNHVPSLVPLIDQVPQLHASIQSLSDRVNAAVSAAAAQSPTDPSPASQLRSPVTDRELSPAEPADNAALFVSATSEPRPNKRRRMEEVLESFETQLDSMQGELDGVADDVKLLCAERAKAKKIRTVIGEKKQSTGNRSLESGEVGEAHKGVEEDLDNLMDTLRALFEGEGPWPERIDTALGRHWTQVLQLPQHQPGAGASMTIAKLYEELEVLKMVIEAHGSGTPAPTSIIDAAHVTWAEKLTEKVMADVGKEQAQFKTELEEVISRALQPVRKVFKALKDSTDI
ncbi:unnamed protein product [Rhizoctonia solani]|uniref:Uncharacterized protein n=1 Tax=Rhizoctonia solani TaxID=456999 RepID=A0A8H2XKJ4_9AGAM|nr:unnamed protein product [Rhizoctonia solani]